MERKGGRDVHCKEVDCPPEQVGLEQSSTSAGVGLCFVGWGSPECLSLRGGRGGEGESLIDRVGGVCHPNEQESEGWRGQDEGGQRKEGTDRLGEERQSASGMTLLSMGAG